MNTGQIEYALSVGLAGTRTRFLGVFHSDCLPTPSSYPACLVANTDPKGEPGTHWVAFYYTSPSSVDFFDPLGLPPLIYSMPTPKLVHSNTYPIQSPTSDACGQYCIYFLYHRSRGLSLRSICTSLEKGGSDRLVNSFLHRLTGSKHLSATHLPTHQCARVKPK